MRRISDSFGARVLIGEIYLPIERLIAYYGAAGEGVHLPFNFRLIEEPWSARALAALIAEYESALPAGAWPNWVLGNHDRPRIAARVGEAQARVAAMLLLTLRGTPTLYYGDELGIGAIEIPRGRVQDPRELREPGKGFGRDPVRTPMPWDESPNAGFTTGTPWLPLGPDWPERNVARQTAAKGSFLTLHRSLLALRRAHPALAIGDLTLLLDAEDDVLAYERRSGADRLLVALNLGGSEQALLLPAWAQHARALLSTLEGALLPAGDRVVLRPNEGVILAPPLAPPAA
jgi:alpha-glucosidase